MRTRTVNDYVRRDLATELRDLEMRRAAGTITAAQTARLRVVSAQLAALAPVAMAPSVRV